jgi:putative acetyltransferase
MHEIKIEIEKGKPEDLKHLQQLFSETLMHVCSTDYDEEQINAWISSTEKKEKWQDIVISQFLLVARHGTKLVGFCSLKAGNYVDVLFVHKDYQRRGIAFKLYAGIEKEARRIGQKELIADVSITAKPFFERMGFTIEKEQIVIRNKVSLNNFRMVKKLNHTDTRGSNK